LPLRSVLEVFLNPARFALMPFPALKRLFAVRRRRPVHKANVGRRLSLEVLEDRTVPDAVSWISHTSGLWAMSANWSTGQVPGAADDVTIDVPEAITVTCALQFASSHSLRSDKALSIRASGSSGFFSVAAPASVNNAL